MGRARASEWAERERASEQFIWLDRPHACFTDSRRKVPFPRAPTRGGTDWGWPNFGASFEPPCNEPPECINGRGHAAPLGQCKCSGQGAPTNPINAEVVDKVLIPADLPAGDYVLGWRWDCEQTPQVWSSCSDVTIRKQGAEA